MGNVRESPESTASPQIEPKKCNKLTIIGQSLKATNITETNNRMSDDEFVENFKEEIKRPSMSLSQKFGCSMNYAIPEDDFAENFEETEYMKWYQDQERFPPLKDTIKGLLKVVPKAMHKEIKIIAKKYELEPKKAIMYIWTLNTKVNEAINLALMLDAYYTFKINEVDEKYIEKKLQNLGLSYKEVIQHSIKFIRWINSIVIADLREENTEERIVFRGVKAKMLENFKENQHFRIVNFL
jgi:hypothetical protein